ncbi:hypothetical protein FQZ97_887450 [compost metagenome]
MRASAGLAFEDRLRRILGHVIADLGFVRAVSLQNLVQLPQALGDAGLLEALAILADVRCRAAVADRRAQHSLVLRIEFGLLDAERPDMAVRAHATLREAGFVAHASSP